MINVWLNWWIVYVWLKCLAELVDCLCLAHVRDNKCLVELVDSLCLAQVRDNKCLAELVDSLCLAQVRDNKCLAELVDSLLIRKFGCTFWPGTLHQYIAKTQIGSICKQQ